MASAAIDCGVCGGTGWRPSTDGAGVVPCECRQRVRAEHALETAGIPLKYRECGFQNFVLVNDSIKAAHKLANIFADDFTPGQAGGLLFMGSPGVGKTHLLVATLRHLISRGFECLFLDYQELLRQIQNSYNPTVRTTEYELLRPVLSAEIVAIDDLGNNRISDWVEDTVTYVVNHRYSNNRPTLFTANLSEARMDGAPGDRTTRPTFDERLGPRVASRLREMCRYVEMNAPDFRARKR